LEIVPSEIGECSSLEYLSFYKNRLFDLPGEIVFLEKLSYLDIEENDIVSLNGEICNFIDSIDIVYTDPDICQ
jgi:Leucine-rich repeat (LRR) protein